LGWAATVPKWVAADAVNSPSRFRLYSEFTAIA
jgi:hypothetical protein